MLDSLGRTSSVILFEVNDTSMSHLAENSSKRIAAPKDDEIVHLILWGGREVRREQKYLVASRDGCGLSVDRR